MESTWMWICETGIDSAICKGTWTDVSMGPTTQLNVGTPGGKGEETRTSNSNLPHGIRERSQCPQTRRSEYLLVEVCILRHGPVK